MRYAIISDLHANLPAWKTVLADLADMKVDKIICLGDVVGYGPDPVGVLEAVYRVVHITLMGNHDAAVCGKIDPCVFSPRAQAAVLRHREQISPRGLAWLSGLPLVVTAPGFRCAHGDFSEPAAFRYIIEAKEALPSWSATQEQLLFVGHSHLPGIYVIGASGVPHFVNPCDFQLEEGKRYIVNPGTVGYPRDGDCRSSYCIYDDTAKSIAFRSLPFDCEGYRKSLREAGLEDDPWMERKEAQHSLPELRARLSFALPLTTDQHAQGVREQRSLTPRVPRKLLLPFMILLLFAAGVAGYTAFAVFKAGRSSPRTPLSLNVPDFDLPSLVAYPLIPPDKNLLPVIPSELSPDGRLAGWRYAFEDRKRQAFGTGLRDGAITLRIAHAGPSRVQLESPLINLAGTNLRMLRLRGQVRRLDDFTGAVFFQLATYTTQPDDSLLLGATHSFEVRDTQGKPAEAAALSRKIPTLPKRVTHVRFRVEADFAGTLEIEQPSLTDDSERARAASRTKGSAE